MYRLLLFRALRRDSAESHVTHPSRASWLGPGQVGFRVHLFKPCCFHSISSTCWEFSISHHDTSIYLLCSLDFRLPANLRAISINHISLQLTGSFATFRAFLIGDSFTPLPPCFLSVIMRMQSVLDILTQDPPQGGVCFLIHPWFPESAKSKQLFLKIHCWSWVPLCPMQVAKWFGYDNFFVNLVSSLSSSTLCGQCKCHVDCKQSNFTHAY